MSNALFPTPPGLDWQVKYTPTFRTLLQTLANGQTVRVPMLTDPMWMFECSFEFLRDDPVHDELNLLLGFFLARQGAFDSFWLDLGNLTGNPADSECWDQPLTVDANNCAPVVRTRGLSGYNEQIYELNLVNGVPQIAVKLNGAPLVLGTDYNVATPAQTAAGTLNGNGITYAGYVVEFLHAVSGLVTADFGFYYRVIFSIGKSSATDPQLGNDEQTWEALWYQLYQAQEITMITARE